MNDEALGRIKAYIEGRTTLCLATCDGARPWAASVFFASDEALNLYFISDSGTRHVVELTANADVAVTINEDVKSWAQIQGLQIDGRAEPVAEEDREEVTALYMDKFPEVAALLNTPEDGDDNAIAAAFMKSGFYRIRPRWIRFIDNSQGFGHSDEVTFE